MRARSPRLPGFGKLRVERKRAKLEPAAAGIAGEFIGVSGEHGPQDGGVVGEADVRQVVRNDIRALEQIHEPKQGLGERGDVLGLVLPAEAILHVAHQELRLLAQMRLVRNVRLADLGQHERKLLLELRDVGGSDFLRTLRDEVLDVVAHGSAGIVTGVR